MPAIIQAHRNLARAMPAHTNLLMKEDNHATQLRQFSLVGELPEFAFPGSYRLELYMLPKDHHQADVQVVNNISVLGRADPERCAACKDRRAAGSRVRGYMHLDPRLILHLLGQLHPDRRAAVTELDHVATLIHGSFGARLVKPDGSKLAAADPHVPAHHTPLDEDKTPKLTLHSHVITLKPTDPTAPIKFGGHETHGAFASEVEWKAL